MAARRRARRSFGATWWGQAWVEALEQRARLDPNRLPRGRTYARHERVGAMTVEPGEVRAPVLGSRASAYRVRIRVRPFTGGEWEAALGAIAAKAAHAAALLDGDLTPAIVDDLASAGIELLPVAGEVGTSCSCPDWANPCKHAAAVCYLIADLLDDDPFVVLLLRGRTRDEVLAGLRSRRAAAGGAPLAAPAGMAPWDDVDGGVVARDAFGSAAGCPAMTLTPLPHAPLPPAHPATHPAPLATDPPPGSGVDAGELSELSTDAARRAWALATGSSDGELSLSFDADLARRAAAAVGTPGFQRLAARSGRRPAEVTRLAIAWRFGGRGAVAVLDDRWEPPAEVVAEARELLASLGRIRVAGNRVSLPGGGQLRFGRDGQWYRLARHRGRWEVVTAPDADPAALVRPEAPETSSERH